MDNKGSENLLQTICIGFVLILSVFIGVWIGNFLLGLIITIGSIILLCIIWIVFIIIKDKSKENEKDVEEIINK